MSSISTDQLLDLIAEVSSRVYGMIKSAYKEGTLEMLLIKLEMEDLIPSKQDIDLFESYPNGKILIVGDTRLKDSDIIGCIKSLGIDKDRVEIIGDYSRIQKYDFNKFRYNPNYRLILAGPIPHSGVSKEDKSSILTQIESDDGYPKVIRLSDSHGLKITKTSLKDALSNEITSGFLEVA